MSFQSLDLDDAFEQYMRKVNPSVSEMSAQYRESRRVWFAAAAIIHYHLLSMTMLSDDEGLKELMQLEKQLHEFKTRVQEHRD
jgi:hypothetical protein